MTLHTSTEAALRIVLSAISIAATAAAQGAGLKVFHIGNSLTDQSYAMHSIAIGKGYTNVQYGRHMIPGAPIHWLWSHQSDGFRQALGPVGSSNSYSTTTSQYLSSTSIDVLVLQLFPQNGDNAQTMTDAGGNFAQAAYQGNPNCQVYVFGSYPEAGADYATTVPSYSMMAVQGAAGISARFPNRKPVLVIPVMQAFQQIGPSGMYADGVHANNNGKYLQALVHFATVYKADPHGAITSGLYMWDGNYSVDAAYAANAQNVAWNVVTTYAQSGVGGTYTVHAAHRTTSPITPSPSVALADLLGRVTGVSHIRAARGMVCSRRSGVTVRVAEVTKE